jgi:TfoX N-terminal domain
MAYDLGLAERVHSILTRERCSFVEKKMFGGLVFMVNGHMCCGMRKTDLMLRLTPQEAAVSLVKPHTRPMGTPTRPLKGMIWVDAHGTDLDDDLESWIQLALSVVRTLPTKGSVVRRARAKRTGK